ncbi:MAG: sugar ABC transporter permease [Ruminococcus sp.]|nr:sugar ABC transporter permease [Ruminococcus sp.]
MKKRTYGNPVGVSRYTGLLLILPFIAGFLLFTLYPFVCSFAVGLTEYDGIRPAKFVGLENYRTMFRDRTFRKSLTVTLRYAAILVPLKLTVSLLTALLLNAEIRGIGFYRTALYIPSVLGANLAVVIMWNYLFTSGGLVNQLLDLMGASPVSWYGDPDRALFVIILLRLWEFGSTMVIFLAALRDIPRDLCDAAKVDGCGRVRTFFSVTLPQLRGVIFVNLILQTIAALQEFNAPYMLTGGGPLKSTYTVGMLIYDEMFRYDMNAGYANAVSWVLFAMISAIVGIMFAVSGRRGRDGR